MPFNKEHTFNLHLTLKYVQALKPKVRIEGGKELVYKEGETATVFADVPSEPAADDIRWFVGGYELVSDPKNGVLIDNSKEHKSKLQIDAVSRKHEGKNGAP